VHTQDLNAIKLQAFVIELGLKRGACRAEPADGPLLDIEPRSWFAWKGSGFEVQGQCCPGLTQEPGRGVEWRLKYAALGEFGRVEILPQRHPEPPSNHCGYHRHAISFPPAEKRPGPSATARAQLSLACSPFQHPALC